MYGNQRLLITNVCHLHLAVSDTLLYAHDSLQAQQEVITNNASQIKILRQSLITVLDDLPTLLPSQESDNLQQLFQSEKANFYQMQNNELMQEQNEILLRQDFQNQQYQQAIENISQETLDQFR